MFVHVFRYKKIFYSLISGIAFLLGPFCFDHTHAQPLIKSTQGLPNIQPWLFEDENFNPQPKEKPKEPRRPQAETTLPSDPPDLSTSEDDQPEELRIPNFSEIKKYNMKNLDTPDPSNPVLTPPFRNPETSPSGNLLLRHSEIVTEVKDDKTSYWLEGRLSNLSDTWVDEVKVHFKIYDQLWVVQSGKFSVHTDCVILGVQTLDFRVPLKETGKLVITFVEWKYADGTQGVSEGGTY